MAEVTIDQLRLGAKLNLYSDQPQPAQAATVQPGMLSQGHAKVMFYTL